MSGVRKTDRVIAILCGDIHLAPRAPVARSAEPDWYAAMQRPLHELHALSEEHEAIIICSGDLFDRWNSPPELINFAIRNVPAMWCIPGQHDLPNHRYDDIRRSAFWTLVECEQIRMLDPVTPRRFGRELTVTAFPWGFDVGPLEESLRETLPDAVHLCVAHSYIWKQGYGFPGAPEDKRLGAYREVLQTYDAALFGDNHSGFLATARDCNVLNNGTLMRRRSDEFKYRPHVGLLRRSGKIDLHYLDTSADKFAEDVQATDSGEVSTDLRRFIRALERLSSSSL